jgi:hypothetical protein
LRDTSLDIEAAAVIYDADARRLIAVCRWEIVA